MCRRISRPELSELEVSWRERLANRVLFAADPDYACSLGYLPPAPVDPEQARMMFDQAVRRWNDQQSRIPVQQVYDAGTGISGSAYISGSFGPFY
jgi:hypothetical protein